MGKRSARQARVSFGKNVLRSPPPPPPSHFSSSSSSSLRRPKVHRGPFRGARRARTEEQDERTDEEEEPDIRRGVDERTGKRERDLT